MEPQTPSRLGTGVIVARFQTHALHAMHLALINYVRNRHKHVLVFIGSTPAIGTRENPLDYETRKQMVFASFPDVKVLELRDLGNDERWSDQLDDEIVKATGISHWIVANTLRGVMLYGGRDSFTKHYKGQFAVTELTSEELGGDAAISATSVRAKVGEEVLASEDFRKGVIYSCQRQYPRVNATVDIGAWRNVGIGPEANKTEDTFVVLGQKYANGLLCLPGGFSDPRDTSFECGAVRELVEETGIVAPVSDAIYVGSFQVDDWRYRGTDRIITTMFGVRIADPSVEPVASDDLFSAGWYPLFDVDQNGIDTLDRLVPFHRPQFESLRWHVDHELKKARYYQRVLRGPHG